LREYLLSIVGTILLSSLIVAILPNGKTTALIKATTRLACVLAIISPILSFMQSRGRGIDNDKNVETFFSQNVIETQDTFINYYSEIRVKETEEVLASELKNLYGANVQVDLQWQKDVERIEEIYTVDKIRITQIYVRFEKRPDEEVIRTMWEYLTKNYCSEVLLE